MRTGLQKKDVFREVVAEAWKTLRWVWYTRIPACSQRTIAVAADSLFVSRSYYCSSSDHHECNALPHLGGGPYQARHEGILPSSEHRLDKNQPVHA